MGIQRTWRKRALYAGFLLVEQSSSRGRCGCLSREHEKLEPKVLAGLDLGFRRPSGSPACPEYELLKHFKAIYSYFHATFMLFSCYFNAVGTPLQPQAPSLLALSERRTFRTAAYTAKDEAWRWGLQRWTISYCITVCMQNRYLRYIYIATG